MSFFFNEELRKKKIDEINSMLERIGLEFTVISDENVAKSFLFFINTIDVFIFISHICASQKKREKYVDQLCIRSYLNQIIDVDNLICYPGICFIDAETE